MTDDKPAFLYEEHPDHPGWMRWGFRDETRYNAFLGEMIVRMEEAGDFKTVGSVVDKVKGLIAGAGETAKA